MSVFTYQTPLTVQTPIAAQLERRLSVEAAMVEANLQRATRLRQSIVKKAFTGELLSDHE